MTLKYLFTIFDTLFSQFVSVTYIHVCRYTPNMRQMSGHVWRIRAPRGKFDFNERKEATK